MSFTDPKKSVKSPASAYFQVDSRYGNSPIKFTLKRESGDIKTEVESINFVVLDENFMQVGGQVPRGGYIASNLIHSDGKQTLRVFEEKTNNNPQRDIAVGEWKSIEETVKRNGGKSVKTVFALLVSVAGNSSDIQVINDILKEGKTILKFDMSGMWWKARNDFMKRLKISNLDRMYIQFARPLIPYDHSYGKSYLPTFAGRKVNQEKDRDIFEKCLAIDAGPLNDFREYIKTKLVNTNYQATAEDFAADNDIPYQPADSQPTTQSSSSTSSIETTSSDDVMDDLPF